MPEKYDELKSAFQKLLYGGELTPDLQAVLVEHGIMSVPCIDPSMTTRCATFLSTLKEPMRDDELGIKARTEIPVIAGTLLQVLPVVRSAVVWRSKIGTVPSNTEAQRLVEQVDTFLRGACK